LTKESLDWFKALPENHITCYEAFAKLFKDRWSTKANGGTLGAQFNQIKKREYETIKEFITIFDKLYNHIPTDYHSTTSSVHFLYINAFEGQFRFILKDKNPTSLA
jgi:hypothetical protein